MRTAERDEAFHCITCSDEGCEMPVLEVDADLGLAVCLQGDGTRESVEIALLDGVEVGDVLLVHAGTALTRVGAA